MTASILLTRTWPASIVDALITRYAVTVNEAARPLRRDELADAMTRFDAICPTIGDRVDAALLATPGRRVRLLGNFGAGYDHIDVGAAAAAGVVVTNTPDVLTEATAELALLLMLMASRRASEGERELRAGRWPGWHPTHLMGNALAGKTLGLVGFGRIAQATARLAVQALRMGIIYYSRNPHAVPPDLGDPRYVADLDTMLAEADVVSLHCPGGAETHHLLDERRLALLKPGAILINTARGSVIDEAALAAALARGHLGGVGLDVYEQEPQVTPSLLESPRAVLLPHLGSATVETRVAMGMRVAANLDAFFNGDAPVDRVA